MRADVGNYTVIAMVVDRQTFCLAAPQRKLGAPVEFQSPCQPTSYNMDGSKVFSITSCGRPAKGQLQRYIVSVTGGADDLCLTAGDDGRMVLDLCNCGSDRQAVSFDGAQNLFSMGPIGPAVMKFVGSGLMCLQPPSGYRPIEGAKVSFCSPGRGFAASQIYVRTEGESRVSACACVQGSQGACVHGRGLAAHEEGGVGAGSFSRMGIGRALCIGCIPGH